MILHHPTGLDELRPVAASGWRIWPPRLPEQPIFCPVTTLAHAERIARDWNAADGAWGFAARFEVSDEVAGRHPVRDAGGRAHRELWVPAGESGAFDAGIVGRVEVVGAWRDREPVAVAGAIEATVPAATPADGASPGAPAAGGPRSAGPGR